MFSDVGFQTHGDQSFAPSVDGIQDSMISAKGHNQNKSYLCWVYSFATSNKSSIRKFVKGLNLPKRQRKRCFEKLNSPDFHQTLRNEICMVIPTNYKKEDAKQAMNVRAMMVRVSLPIKLIVSTE